MYSSVTWILWNLLLALIPVGLGYAAAWLGQRAIGDRASGVWLVLVPLLALWLVFLPNSCYLFTESRHLFSTLERDAMWTRARHEPAVAMRLAIGGAVALLYAAFGSLTFALSIRPVKRWLEHAGVRTGVWAPFFFLLVSLGVYLGLVVRFNSWDVLTRPEEVLETIAGVADRPRLVATIGVFALFLWFAYELNDIWVDGFSLRWRQWTARRS
jgi:uncharacterized membrane protein